ncbi:hypothetical protein KB206_02145 [Microvirga sp. STS02]|uniref:hypothetical protein n=1 Tax=Hymenobacter negativus TaxID=2795026 RepID=UPI0018DCB405|nr:MULTISPECIES: hypothetical protein [Bacteria]MBH8567667.1 hypothetical protein [Hymenobacter negativus]MBR7207401.1 hypothetical protein [Microvirga sp. STS02]
MPNSTPKTLAELIAAFKIHSNTLSVLKSPTSPGAYASTIRGAIQLKPGELLQVAKDKETFLEDVLGLLHKPKLTSDQGSALRLFHASLTLPVTIIGVDKSTAKTRSPRSASSTSLKAVSSSPSSLLNPVTLTQPLTIERDYMRRQFVGRLESQERYYPNLFRKQPNTPAVCLRYPATFFRYRNAPGAIRQAVDETIRFATDNIVFFINDSTSTASPSIRALPFSDITSVEIVLAKESTAHAYAICRSKTGVIGRHQLMQRLHSTAAGYEPFCLPATALAKAATKGPVGSAKFTKSLFTHLSLDHVEPFVDTLRANITQLPGLLALTELISQRGAPPVGSPNAHYFPGMRDLYKGMCQPGAMSTALVVQVAADIRFLASTIKLEILLTSRNSQRGATTFSAA